MQADATLAVLCQALAMHDSRQRRIAVVGGGLAGLEVAVVAAEAGSAVEVFEAGPRTRTRHVNWDTSSHAGDEKVRPWTCDGWTTGGGLTARLGGRSLCYHGVLLTLEPAALASWDPAWHGRLSGEEGLYESVLDSLRPHYPELGATQGNPRLEALGLRHVPQAARLDDRGRFESYSPLARTLELFADGRIAITRGRVRAVVPDGRGCAIEVERPAGVERRAGYDACVLASSAIGNVPILAASLGRDITTTVTDHFCVGAFVRLPPGAPLVPFRHDMLWSGFAEVPELVMNVFVHEQEPLPCHDRIVLVYGVVEQQQPDSTLTVQMLPTGVRTHVRADLSHADSAHLDAARAEVRRWATLVAGTDLISADACPSEPVTALDSSDHPWTAHDRARNLVTAADRAGVLAEFEVSFGGFEHEACTHPLGNGGPVPVSANLEVLELPGVRVAGPGAFPRLGIANPALTIIAMSRWLGAQLGSDS